MAFEAENPTPRAEQTDRRQQIRTLLAQKLDEDFDELSPSDLQVLARELRRTSHREQFKSFAESDLAKGLLWAAGGMAVALFVLPQLQNALVRPEPELVTDPQS